MTDVLDRPNADTELDFSVLEALDFEIACQSGGHEKFPDFHEGAATHRMVSYVPCCGRSGDLLVCSKLAEIMAEPENLTHCTPCKITHRVGDVVQILEKI